MLGMILAEMCLLKPMHFVYDHKLMAMKQSELADVITEIGLLYDENLSSILKVMLKPAPSERPTLQQLGFIISNQINGEKYKQ